MNTISIHTDNLTKMDELTKAAVWAIDEIMPRQNKLKIHVKFKRMKEWGLCEPIFWERSPKEFSIHIKSDLSLKTSIRVLLHEMVHVRQFATNRLRNVKNKMMWMKEEHDGTPYSDQPWEIEARIMEDILYNLYFDK